MFLEADDVSVSELNHVRRLQRLHRLQALNLTSQPNSSIPTSGFPDSLYHKHAHFVFKKKAHSSDKHHDFMPLEPGSASLPFNWTLQSSASNHSFHHRSKRQSPDTVWPEVLLVVDYDSYLLHGGNSRDVKRYFISFWNGVDLRYKLLSHPRIRVSLAGMIVAKVSSSSSMTPSHTVLIAGSRRNAVLGAQSIASSKCRRGGRGRCPHRHGQVPVPRRPAANVRLGRRDHEAGHVPAPV